MDDDDDEKLTTWLEAFKSLFKPISDSDIDNYCKEYVGSDLEKSDLKKAYVNGKGCINYIMEHVPFMSVEDEPRFNEIIKEWIKNEDVPDFPAYTNEPKSKRDRRHKKYARESKEADSIKKKMNKKDDENDLAMMIAKRQNERAKGFGSFMDQLAAAYADGEDEDDVVDFDALDKKVKKGKKKGPIGKPKKETPIKRGRVSKRK